MRQTYKPLLIALVVLLNSFSLQAQQQAQLDRQTLKNTIDKALTYIVENQVKQTKGIQKFRGEWQANMELDRNFLLLGKKGYSAKDSNIFTSGSIHNILAQLVIDHPEYREQLKPVLRLAMNYLLKYKRPDRETFGFWQQLPKRQHILKKDESAKLALPIRRSNNFFIKYKLVNYAENVPDDADDTSMMLLAYGLHEQATGQFIARVKQPSRLFDAYLDVKRKRMVNLYNIKGRGKHATSAYLTWFAAERRKFATAIPKKDQVYLPLGVNDVDCVVNANVMATLSYYQDLQDSAGFAPACRYLKRSIKKMRHKVCGMYYPNWYNFHYSVAKLKQRGVSCLDQELPLLVKHLLKKQEAQGSWHSYKSQIKGSDRIQSTVYALSSLLNLGDIRNQDIRLALERGFSYLMSKGIESEHSLSWPGGIFFSGGTIVRKTVLWRSDAYTTALVLESLVKYLDLLDRSDHT